MASDSVISQVARLEGHAGYVRSVAWNPSGERLASGSDDKTAVVWDPTSGAKVAQLEGHAGAVLGVACSPDGGRLASCGADKTVMTWDAWSGERVSAMSGHARAATAVSWSPGSLPASRCAGLQYTHAHTTLICNPPAPPLTHTLARPSPPPPRAHTHTLAVTALCAFLTDPGAFAGTCIGSVRWASGTLWRTSSAGALRRRADSVPGCLAGRGRARPGIAERADLQPLPARPAGALTPWSSKATAMSEGDPGGRGERGSACASAPPIATLQDEGCCFIGSFDAFG